MMTNADKVRRYCSYQDRSSAEVRRKMAQLLMPKEESEALMRELIEESYVDDERFAESFIRGKVNIKRWGRVKIRVELAQHGIPSAMINAKLAEIDADLYLGNLQYLVDRWRRENPDGENPKLFRFLLGKGYESSEISAILKTNNN